MKFEKRLLILSVCEGGIKEEDCVCVWGGGGDRVACGVGPYVRGGGGYEKK